MLTEIPFDNILDTREKKLAFYQNMLIVAVADKFVNENESNFLLSVREQLNLSKEDTQPILKNLSTLSFIIPEDGRQKLLELQTLVRMIFQDGEIREKEYNMCLDFAKKIGYNKEILDEMIENISRVSG